MYDHIIDMHSCIDDFMTDLFEIIMKISLDFFIETICIVFKCRSSSLHSFLLTLMLTW